MNELLGQLIFRKVSLAGIVLYRKLRPILAIDLSKWTNIPGFGLCLGVFVYLKKYVANMGRKRPMLALFHF